MRTTLIMMLATFSAATLWALPGKISTDSETLSGEIVWQARNKQYIVTVKKGKTTVDKEIKFTDVRSLDIAKPEGFDKAVAQVDEGQGAVAIPSLEKILATYRMLQWDKPAARALARAHLAAGNAQKAFDVCEGIVKDDKSAGYTGDMAAAYWQALLKLGKNDQLDKLLKKAATSGSRASAAAACVMRGDIIVAAANDNPEQLRQALADGYMRVVLMYPDAEAARERAEAIGKAATIFDKLGQGARAEKLRAEARAL